MNNFTKIVSRKFLNTVNKFSMLENVETVVVGFSGGADSVCLLHLIHTYKSEFGYNIKAIHVNHGIRGNEAERDEVFAEKFCKDFDISFEVVKVDCIEEAKRTKESVEECGRRLRYKAFNSFCSVNSKIATAHNANDNAETVIFNMARGTTVKGLCGIPYVRDNIIRPILDCSRAEIEGYCKENNLSFVTDSTNLSVDYTRNKIRHEILPVIEEINPSFLDSFSSLSDNARYITGFVGNKADKLLTVAEKGKNIFDRQLLLNHNYAVSAEVLFKAYKNFSSRSLDNKKVKALQGLLKDGGRLQLYGNDFAEVKKDYIRFYRADIKSKTVFCIADDFPFSVDMNDFTVTLEKFNNNSKIVNQNCFDNMIDYDTVVGNLVLRTRNPGDEFTFIKRNVTKSLKKLFTEENIPVELRDQLPVISDDVGVVWVQGFGVTKRCFSSKSSRNIVLVKGEYNDR